MAHSTDQHLLPQPKAPPRWKGLALRVLGWVAVYGVAAVVFFGIVNLVFWR